MQATAGFKCRLHVAAAPGCVKSCLGPRKPYAADIADHWQPGLPAQRPTQFSSLIETPDRVSPWVKRYRQQGIHIPERFREQRQNKFAEGRRMEKLSLKLQRFQRAVYRKCIQKRRKGLLKGRWMQLTVGTMCAWRQRHRQWLPATLTDNTRPRQVGSARCAKVTLRQA
jgi:hypothetical protein